MRRRRPIGDPGPGREALASRLFLALITALGVIFCAAQLRAQTMHDLTPGTLEPCLAPHFDRDRYAADLAAIDWVPVAEGDREAARARLADAFLPILRVAGEGETEASRRTAARAEWRLITEGRTLMSGPAGTVFVVGYTTQDDARAVECWMAPTDPALSDAILDLAITQGSQTASLIGETARIGPADLGDGRTLSLFATRLGAAEDRPAAHGLMTRTEFREVAQ